MLLAWKQHSAVPMLALFTCGSVVCLKSCRCDDHSVRRANETVDPTILLTWITFFPCAHRIEANLQDMALYFRVGTFEDHHADEAGRLFQRNFYLLSLRLWFRSLCRPGRLFRGGLRLPCLIRSIVHSRLFGHKLLGMCRLQSVLECASEPRSRSPPCC